MLGLLGEGRGDDAAFQAVLGLDTPAIDAAVRRWIRDEFPTTATRGPAGGGS
jgi:hypothetical protein